MPAIVDVHVHMRTTREELIEDLQRRAYWGVGAGVSMRSDVAGAPLELRGEIIPGAACYRSAGLDVTRPEPGRFEVHWVNTEEEARQHGLRVIAHIFTLEDAKGLVGARVVVFAHGVRDRDIDDEFVEMVAWKPGLVLIPNLPERDLKSDPGWLAGYLPRQSSKHCRRRRSMTRSGKRRTVSRRVNSPGCIPAAR